jgi:hypothetical protein
LVIRGYGQYQFDLLGNGKGVLDLDAEILHGAFDLGMPKQ